MNDRFRFRAWDIKFKELCPIDTLFIDEDGLHVEGRRPSGGAVVLEPGEFRLDQCTNCKDKNGSLIFENDVLLLEVDGKKYTGVVEWQNGFVIDWQYEGGSFDADALPLYWSADQALIIGVHH